MLCFWEKYHLISMNEFFYQARNFPFFFISFVGTEGYRNEVTLSEQVCTHVSQSNRIAFSPE